ncbi:M48 family metalloprotease [Desulfosarcina sp. OttesenSCG-928-A07]|nr:M48 family metalloprotease [Desulfosarcina sp. OttesenSCG-928-G17]MDL2329619.1 M48 family metalloprotease [Desulfosarcina sp. OttesenSCG-928-A07]
MFENFIYFIIAILVCTTYDPSKPPLFSTPLTLILTISLFLVFFAFSRYLFTRMARVSAESEAFHQSSRFSTMVTGQSVLAIFLFAVTIHGLNLPSLFSGMFLFKVLPTLEILIFIGIFTGYKGVIGVNAHTVYRQIYPDSASCRDYVFSSLSFGLPVLFPWALFSGIFDLLLILPTDFFRKWLSSTAGEMAYFLFFLVFIAILGPVLMLKCWRCHPLPDSHERRRIEAVSQKARVRYADILCWPVFGGHMITAGVMGLVKRFQYLLITPALLRILSPEEIDAVVAHEAGHIRHHHLVLYLFFLTGYMVGVWALSDLVMYLIMAARPLYQWMFSLGISRSTVMTTFTGLFLIASFLIYFRYVFGYFMRNFERQADGFVYTLFPTALPLVTAFRKIAMASGQPPDTPSWHHFSIRQRIDFLMRCETDSQTLDRHHRKIRIMMAVYAVFWVMIGITGYELQFGKSKGWLNEKMAEIIIREKSEEGEDKTAFYAFWGDLYFSRNEVEKAISAYEKALSDDPENAGVLNNLAWVLATSPEPALRDPGRALKLAEKAVHLDPSPHVMDTLAESFFVNGEMDRAIEVESMALKKATGNTDHYKAQLEKFRAAKKHLPASNRKPPI